MADIELDEQDAFIMSQEAMRPQDHLLFSTYNFGSEPQEDGTQHNGHAADTEQINRRKWKGKIFSDPIHNTFRLEPVNVAVIDTPQFQRLRQLHQLGLTHLVFPGAVHTRFEHSLGTSYKAFEVAERLYRFQGRELGMEPDDIRLVSLAGLCHDLGHGPFSHVFEHEFIRRKLLGEARGSEAWDQLNSWHHETMSTKILEYLVDDNNIDCISQEDIRRISDLIKGDVHEDRGFLFDIVNNKRCGVDVDKVDYLQRDAKMCDVSIGCDFKRLLLLSKVLENQIAYKWSEYDTIKDLFHARESMHRKVYTHRKTKAVEFMVVDALLEADQALGFSDNIHTAEDFCTLDDSLLTRIENYGKFDRRRKASQQLEEPLDNGADGPLRRAQDIIKRLHRRDLYRYGNQFIVPHSFLESGQWERISRDFTEANVASCYGGGDIVLEAKDVIVSQSKIDYTAGLGNPLNNVLFFNDWQDTVGRHIQPHQVVGILPQYHQERILRVYTPHQGEVYKKAVGEALESWCKRIFGSNAQMATPARPRFNPFVQDREHLMREADPRRGYMPPLPRSTSTTGGGTAAATAGNVAAVAPVYRGATSGSGAAPGSVPRTASGTGGIDGGVVASGGGGTGDPRPGPSSAAAAGSAAGPGRASGAVEGLPSSHHSHSHPDAADDGGGTPTRSTPLGMGSTLSSMVAASDAGAGGVAGEADGAAATGGRASKRARSSGALFQDS